MPQRSRKSANKWLIWRRDFRSTSRAWPAAIGRTRHVKRPELVAKICVQSKYGRHLGQITIVPILLQAGPARDFLWTFSPPRGILRVGWPGVYRLFARISP